MDKNRSITLQIPFTVHEMFERSALIFPEKVFVSDETTVLSYARFIELAKKLSAYLSRDKKINFGDRIVIASSNSVIHVLFLYACSTIGSILVPINNNLKGKRLNFLLSDSNPSIIFTDSKIFATNCGKSKTMFCKDWDSFYDVIKKTKPSCQKNKVIDLDPFLIIYTSGSTGNPKGILLNHSNIISSSESIARYLEIGDSDQPFQGSTFK